MWEVLAGIFASVPVADLQNVAIGLGVIALTLIGWLGRMNARSAPPTREESRIEVSGALIDGRDARALRDAIAELTEALEAHAKLMREMADFWRSNTHAADKLHGEVGELRAKLKSLETAIGRLSTAVEIANHDRRN